MLNKIKFLLCSLWLCASLPSFAYVIGANLTIKNQTDVPMEIVVLQPKRQGPIFKSIPAHQTTEIYMENGDRTGWLYQASVAPFSIKGAAQKTEYVNGRVAYYVGGAFWSKYSFLDSVAAGKGISAEQTYSCENGGIGIVFENRIILTGNPDEPARVNPNHGEVHCKGVKASELNNDQYFLKCSDDRQTIFAKLDPNQDCRPGHYSWSPHTDGCFWWTGNRRTKFVTDPFVHRTHGLKVALDDGVGRAYCKSFVQFVRNL